MIFLGVFLTQFRFALVKLYYRTIEQNCQCQIFGIYLLSLPSNLRQIVISITWKSIVDVNSGAQHFCESIFARDETKNTVFLGTAKLAIIVPQKRYRSYTT